MTHFDLNSVKEEVKDEPLDFKPLPPACNLINDANSRLLSSLVSNQDINAVKNETEVVDDPVGSLPVGGSELIPTLKQNRFTTKTDIVSGVGAKMRPCKDLHLNVQAAQVGIRDIKARKLFC